MRLRDLLLTLSERIVDLVEWVDRRYGDEPETVDTSTVEDGFTPADSVVTVTLTVAGEAALLEHRAGLKRARAAVAYAHGLTFGVGAPLRVSEALADAWDALSAAIGDQQPARRL